MSHPLPTGITLHRVSRVLEISFDDGAHFELPAEYLRVHSPSAEVQGHGPGQKVLVSGKAAHSGNPSDGVNAVYGAAAVISELERWHHELAEQAHPLVGPPTWSVGLVQGGTGASIVLADGDHSWISTSGMLTVSLVADREVACYFQGVGMVPSPDPQAGSFQVDGQVQAPLPASK